MSINYSLTEIRAFIAVASFQSFGRAADVLGLSPSAVSRRIFELEQTLGTQLFERTTRSVVLTRAGRILLADVTPVLQKMDESLTKIAQEAQGDGGWLDVGCVTSVCFAIAPRVARAFKALYPKMHLRLHDSTGKTVTHSVLRGDTVFAVNSVLNPPSDLYVREALHDSYVLVVPKGHAMATESEVSWKRLATLSELGLTLLALNQSSANRQEVDQELRSVGVAVPWGDEVQHFSSLIGFLKSGGFAAVLPQIAMHACEEWGLKGIALKDPTIHRRIGLIRRRDFVLPQPAAALWTLFEKELANLAAQGGQIPDLLHME
ncbi:LysR family transcriptional regulator [Rhizobium oryzicola]|uniref:LysR family transcriptional regulator n=1 Tax=Rhizobium oryzicola TaxID=1232668 RepID=A0ABT8SX40_9HYPH|nr:LysR family transcriptional regulator [Rhizobium oryzicola]MDO1582561.1 LysR family transcriptional regulator [Rhizobium oryzicola]